MHLHLPSSPSDLAEAQTFRQRHFFDEQEMLDPYQWTLGKEGHLHYLLRNDQEMVGYAHIQLWPNQRAALRIIVIHKDMKGSGLGSYLLKNCEVSLKERGIVLLQTESSRRAYPFYKKLNYIEMPFDDPAGEPTHPDDTAMGKFL